jgi:hypothetical protein
MPPPPPVITPNPFLTNRAAEVFGYFVLGIVGFGPGGPEDTDRSADVVEPLYPFHKLTHDFKKPPGFSQFQIVD